MSDQAPRGKRKKDDEPFIIHEPELTPLEWEVLKTLSPLEGETVEDLHDEIESSPFRDYGYFDEDDVRDAVEYLRERGMARTVWLDRDEYRRRHEADELDEDDDAYVRTDYGLKQIHPDITGIRGGGEKHKQIIRYLISEFINEGFYVHADRGFGEKKPDLLLLLPRSPFKWDLYRLRFVEVEVDAGAHLDRVRANIEKAKKARAPVYFFTDTTSGATSIARELKRKGMTLVSPEAFFERWTGPGTAAVNCEGEETDDGIFEAMRELGRKGYHFRIKKGRYLYARRKARGKKEEIYLGKVCDDFEERLEGCITYSEHEDRILSPKVRGKTIKWTQWDTDHVGETRGG